MDKDITRLDISLYGLIEPISETLSKCRVRIFYKGLNRNLTYISDDFAQQLIDSLPYTPVKGIFDNEGLDFGEHGEKNSEGRIYGIIPENPNVTWEQHTDEDGIIREYACADVILFTGLYPEAKIVCGKGQSMEIHKAGLQGEWRYDQRLGEHYFYFLKGHLLGLQVLGDDVEPCFEGASFFSLIKEVKGLMNYIKQENKKESEKMDKNFFKLSDSEKCGLLYDAVYNKLQTEEFVIWEIYDEYCLVRVYSEDRKYYRCYYTKDNEANTVTLGDIVEVFITDVTETEYNALEGMKALGSFSEISEKISAQEASIEEYKITEEELRNSLTEANTQIEALNNSLAEKETEYTTNLTELNTKISEFETTTTEYETQLTEKNDEIVRLNSSLEDIKNEKLELENFKTEIETKEKEGVIEEFSAALTDEQISSFKENMINYSVEDFKKEVCFAAYKSGSSIVSKKEEKDSNLLYKNTEKDTEAGVLGLLKRHKGGNK